MQDYYETLQVHPRADSEAIRAAYERLRQRYDPAQIEGAADELVDLARRRRDEIERAYAVLSDPARRADFEKELGARVAERAQEEPEEAHGPVDDELIDYRPLPPARRQERPRDFNAQPYLAPSKAARRSGRRVAGKSGQPSWIVPALIVAVATFAIVLITLVTTVWNAPQQTTDAQSGASAQGQPTAAAPTPSVDDVVNQFEGQIGAARQVALQVPDNPKAWIELGNALYDSIIVVRERLDSGDTRFQAVYIERLPRWLEASDAYARALEIDPANAVARADMATALCYYGVGINDQSYVAQGIDAANRAAADAPEEGRVLLSKGLCLISLDPPQTEMALEQWQKAVVMPNIEPGVAQQARQLIAEYSR